MNAKKERKKTWKNRDQNVTVYLQVLQLKRPCSPPLYYLYFLNFSNKDELFIRKKNCLYLLKKKEH